MKAPCPTAKTPARRVHAQTVRSLVRENRFQDVEGREWFFCETPECDVVYFAADGTTLDKRDVDVRVGIKEEEPPHTVCYCFGHTVESIQDEIRNTGRSTAFDSITEKVKAGECSCEVLNPKGTCCLGDVRIVAQEAMGASHANQDGPEDDCCAAPAPSREAPAGHSCCSLPAHEDGKEIEDE